MMWALFNKPTKVAAPVGYVILDDDGIRTEIDRTYAEQGINEGWLMLSGYFENQYGFYWTYVLRD